MQKKLNMGAVYQLFLRLALGLAYFVYGCDRLGVWGSNGGKYVSWGDWAHFMQYAGQVMSFLPPGLVKILAVIATAGEITFGLALILGFKTKLAAYGAGVLSLLFAISMTISFNILSPLGYGVFAFSAGSFLLATVEKYAFSIDNLLGKKAGARMQF